MLTSQTRSAPCPPSVLASSSDSRALFLEIATSRSGNDAVSDSFPRLGCRDTGPLAREAS